MSKWTPLLFLLAMAGILFFLGLGSLGLTDRDEGSNAEAAREMLQSGDWITPTLNGEPRFAKPVFIYWLMSAAYRLLGVNEFSARFTSAVSGFGLILLQYIFLSRVRGSGVGLLGALMLLLNVEIVAISRLALTDSVLIFLTTLSLYSFWLGLHGNVRQRQWFWVFYIAMALGTLTKGPIGVAVPLLGIIPYLSLTQRWNFFWQRSVPLAGILIFLLVSVPWYAAMLVIHGSRYTTSAQADTIGRFLSVVGGHGGTVLLYLPVLLIGFFPWSGFLPASVYQTFRDWRRNRRPRRANQEGDVDDLELFAALWFLAVFVFFSASATRLPHYIGPLFPAAAILTATYWNRCLTTPTAPGLHASLFTMMATGYVLGLTLASSSSLYSTFIDKIAKEFPAAPYVQPGLAIPAAGFVLLIGMAFVSYFGFSDTRRAGTFWAAAATITLVMIITTQVILPRFSTYFIAPAQELAYAAGVNLQDRDSLIFYGPQKPSLLFYARRLAIVIKPGEEAAMQSHLKGGERKMILLPSRLKTHLPPETSTYSVILERYGYSLLANEPMVRVPAVPMLPAPSLHGRPK